MDFISSPDIDIEEWKPDVSSIETQNTNSLIPEKSNSTRVYF